MARKPPKSPEQRLARWSRSMAPGTLNGRVASATPLTLDVTRLGPRLRQRQGAGFDPNEEPVIIGAGATAGGGSTPSNITPGFAETVTVGKSAHTGAADATAVGCAAEADGDTSTAIGCSAYAGNLLGVAVGYAAVQADYGTAVGAGAAVVPGGTSGTAIGRGAEVSHADATAVGRASLAAHDSSTAIGHLAATTADNQVMLGTDAGFVEIPGDSSHVPNGLVLTDTDGSGTRWIVQVTGGALAVNPAP